MKMDTKKLILTTIKHSMKEKAQQDGETELFAPAECSQLGLAKSAVEKSRNRQLKELFHAGFGIHHAG